MKGHPYELALFYWAPRCESGIWHRLLLSPYRSVRDVVTCMPAAGHKEPLDAMHLCSKPDAQKVDLESIGVEPPAAQRNQGKSEVARMRQDAQ
jgi:hypothetical protein